MATGCNPGQERAGPGAERLEIALNLTPLQPAPAVAAMPRPDLALHDAVPPAGGQLPQASPAEVVMATTGFPPGAPLGAAPGQVRIWFDAVLRAELPVQDGSLEAERDAARAFSQLAKAENTRRAYVSAVRTWCAWCEHRGLTPLPACGPDVAAFLAGERTRGLTPETIKLRRAAIRYLHRVAGCPVPTDDACVSETLAGIQRSAVRQGEHKRKKKAATVQVLRRLIAPINDDLVGLRDRAMLLVGFAGALRRSELAAIRISDLEPTERGLRLTLDHSKGSQAAAVMVPLPYGETELCPVRALERWLAAACISEGAVFRRIWRAPGDGKGEGPALPRLGAEALTAQSVALVVQARAVAAGFGRRELGGHSLKRGAITTGMDRGVHPTKLKRLGRHQSYNTLGEYLEFGDLFEGHPLGGVI